MTYFQARKKPTVREIKQFRGVNFTDGESTLSLDTAAAASNMYVNERGHIVKRTGYRRLFEGAERINGLFVYEYIDKHGTAQAHRLLHMGNALYLCTVTADELVLGECISTALENKKSRSFVFGGALYLLGAGYFKIAYDAALDMLICGRVRDTECNTDAPCVLATDCEPKATPLSGNKRVCADASAQEKAVKFLMARYSFIDGTKLYIVPPEAAQAAQIVRVEYTDADGNHEVLSPLHYQIGTDKTGLYVQLKRNDTYFDTYKYIQPQVVFAYNGFVHTPANVILRTPSAQKAFGDPGVVTGPFYDGTLLESYNLAAPQRSVEFSVPAGDRTGSKAGYRFHLEPGGEGKVLRIYIDGVLVQKYSKFAEGTSVPTVGSYKCHYAELEASLLPNDACTVRIEYIRQLTKTVAPFAYVTDTCTVFSLFGGENDTRVFLSGSPSAVGYDFAGGLYDATYFPDSGYTLVGSDASAIVGYHKISGYQVILKDGKNHDASQYLRSFRLDESSKPVFSLVQGAQGVGAVNPSAFKVLRDHMLFAADGGIYELRTTAVQTQTNLRCLSDAVRARLSGADLSAAVCAVWGDWYCVACGGSMLILDTVRDMAWYAYDGLPEITCIFTDGDSFYFGTADGCVCRFMTAEEPNAYYDGVGSGADLSAARAICAYWDVPVTALGNGFARKTIEDFCLYLLPEVGTSVRIAYTTEHTPAGRHCHSEAIGRFDFTKLNFSDFSFEASDFPVCINTRAKAKRVRVFGARIENSVPGERLCVSGFAVKYRENNAIK